MQMHRLDLSWTDMTERTLAECQAEIKKHEFQSDYDRSARQLVKLWSLSKKNFIALKLKNFNDEINNFFMNVYCSKIWNYVKLIRKVSMKWKIKEVSEFHLRHLQDEDSSRVRTLFWNLLARYRFFKMKLIA